MPWYTEEKMTNQQIEDLRAYIEMKAFGNEMDEGKKSDELSIGE